MVLFAAGNGGPWDNSNDDPYTSHRYTISVGAIGDDDRMTSYSEPGACILVGAPSNGGWRGITTTDVVGGGYDPTKNSTTTFGGTSAATPLVAGIVVLLLRARPELGWRDVHAILALTARKNDPSDAGWRANGAGHLVHPFYGFGMVDAQAAVMAANDWRVLPHEVEDSIDFSGLLSPLGTSVPLTLTSPIRVETVTLSVNISHPHRGDLLVTLKSPSGTTSELTTPVPASVFCNLHGGSCTGTPSFVPRDFSSVHFRDEISSGTWEVGVTDVGGSGVGTLFGVTLVVHGVVSCYDEYDDCSCETLYDLYRASGCCQHPQEIGCTSWKDQYHARSCCV